jgi:hypothetical protein
VYLVVISLLRGVMHLGMGENHENLIEGRESTVMWDRRFVPVTQVVFERD